MSTLKKTLNKNTRKTIKKSIRKNTAIIDDKFTLDPKKKYKTIGIVHATTAQPINLLRDFGNDIANAFGAKGFDGSLFDKTRHDAVSDILKQVNNKQKIQNVNFDFELKGDQLIIMNAWGTLLQEI